MSVGKTLIYFFHLLPGEVNGYLVGKKILECCSALAWQLSYSLGNLSIKRRKVVAALCKWTNHYYYYCPLLVGNHISLYTSENVKRIFIPYCTCCVITCANQASKGNRLLAPIIQRSVFNVQFTVSFLKAVTLERRVKDHANR